MTLIEFFDDVPIDNMVSCLSIKPEKVVFVGDKKPMKKQEDVYLRLTEKYNIQVVFEYVAINKNSVEQIVETLADIVENEEDCVFDLTGGDDLVLVAMGIVYERYREKKNIQMHRFNTRTGTIHDCDSDGVLPELAPLKLTVKDNIMIYGGDIVSFNGSKGTYDWNFDDEFELDVRVMWDICKNNPGLWNTQIGTFAYISRFCSKDPFQLDMSANKQHIKEFMENDEKKYAWDSMLIRDFQRYGLIKNFSDDDDYTSFEFKNKQVKLCLTKEGTLLELMVLIFAKAAKDKDGAPKYNDIVNGAYIDWDSTIHDITDEEKDTENEIDVILMRGLVPIFISCKNGYVDENELYKLNSVAEKFGGPYVQKVLIATYFGKSTEEGHKYFVQRAKDMKIQLIENVHDMSDDEFAKAIKNILC